MRLVIQPTDPAGHTGATESGRRATQAHVPGTEAGCPENELAILVHMHCRLHIREGIEDEEEIVDVLQVPCARDIPTDRPCRPHGFHGVRPAGHSEAHRANTRAFWHLFCGTPCLWHATSAAQTSVTTRDVHTSRGGVENELAVLIFWRWHLIIL